VLKRVPKSDSQTPFGASFPASFTAHVELPTAYKSPLNYEYSTQLRDIYSRTDILAWLAGGIPTSSRCMFRISYINIMIQHDAWVWGSFSGIALLCGATEGNFSKFKFPKQFLALPRSGSQTREVQDMIIQRSPRLGLHILSQFVKARPTKLIHFHVIRTQ
jgi:hypothetical protein